MMEEKNLNLTKIEENIIIGLQARERELFREVLQPLQDAFRYVIAQVESRLGLPKDSIGTEYNLDQESWCLKKVQPVAEASSDNQG
jgi:hypothetical protein